ncbi:unnamed protein product [Sphagnum compactum]
MAQKKLWNIAISGSEDEMRNLLLNRSNVDVNEEKRADSPLHKAIQHNQDTGVVKVQSFPFNDSCITKELKEFWTYIGMTPLHVAARFACPKVVELLIKDPSVNVDASTNVGLTALHLVAEGDENPDRDLGSRRPQEDRCKVVQMLLQAERTPRASDVGCHLNRIDDFKREFLPFQPMEQEERTNFTALHFAAQMGSLEIVDLLLREPGIKINVQDDEGCTPLHIASQAGRVNVVERFLEQEPCLIDLTSQNSSSLTPLDLAIDKGHAAVNKDRNTPLHLAAEGGHVEVVQLLLERCCTLDLEVKNFHGNTLLHQATKNGHDKVVQVLLDHAATEFDLDDQNNDGNTPLHLATKEGHVEVVNVLLGCGLELRLDAENKDFNTPLHLASEEGYLEVVKVLLEHADGEKCGLNSENVDWNSPLHLAIEEGHVDVVKELLERAGTKLKLNEKNRNDSNTLLHLAAEAGQDEIVAMLLALDAPKQTADSDSTERNNDQKRTTKLNLNAANKEENTPLHLACLFSNTRISIE